MTGAAKAAASAAAEVPSFYWLWVYCIDLLCTPSNPLNLRTTLKWPYRDTADKVPKMGELLADIRAQNKAGASPPIAGQFVVYDLPDRDCAALASNGEFSIANGGVANYKAYIDAIREVLVEYSDVQTILVVGG